MSQPNGLSGRAKMTRPWCDLQTDVASTVRSNLGFTSRENSATTGQNRVADWDPCARRLRFSRSGAFAVGWI